MTDTKGKRPSTWQVLGKFESWAKEMPRAELGGLIKEYIAESNHGSWDGFDSRDRTGIARLLQDIMTYYDNALNNTPEGFATKISNVNPVP
jgi:hypothetical protein